LTIFLGQAFGKTLLRAFGPLEFVGAGEPAASTFACALVLFLLAAGLLPFFLGPHREWLIDLDGGCAAGFLFEFFDALLGRFQLPLQRHDDVKQALNVDTSRTHVLFELLDGVHAARFLDRVNMVQVSQVSSGPLRLGDELIHRSA